MIIAGSYLPIGIDLGKDEPGMTLSYASIDCLLLRKLSIKLPGAVGSELAESATTGQLSGLQR